MNRKALLIINPISGTRSKRGLISFVSAKLAEAGIDVHAEMTRGSGDAFVFASRAEYEGFDMVISAGGDGTVNEIACALSHGKVPLGIVPMGSGNGFARSLGIPQDITEALKIISDGNILVCDRGIAGPYPFYCAFGVGLDALVSEKFAGMKKRGRVTYVRSVLREFLNYKSQPYAISIEGKVLTEKALLIAVCNAPQYGNNAYIAPKAKLSDGELDVTVVHSGNPFETAFMGVELLTGHIDRDTHIETFKVKDVTITRLDKGPVHVDGEPHILGKKIRIECDPAALRVYAPEKEQEFRPIVSPFRAMVEDIRYEILSRLR